MTSAMPAACTLWRGAAPVTTLELGLGGVTTVPLPEGAGAPVPVASTTVVGVVTA